MLNNMETIYLRLYPDAIRYTINGNSYVAKDMGAMKRATAQYPAKDVAVEKLAAAQYLSGAAQNKGSK